jgi:DNA-directed RNA polymerase specialized sigma subunit
LGEKKIRIREIRKNMKNREIMMRRLERAEGNIEKLHFTLNRQGTREQFEEILQETRELIQETKAFIQQEPLGPGEINQY